jgi:hypothetical protein
MTRAVIVQGGLALHRPEETSALLAEELRGAGLEVDVVGGFEVFSDAARMAAADLIVLNWHMGDVNWRLGTITPEQVAGLIAAVESGCGLAGIHAGLGDAFRNEVAFQFVVGGQWVAHPGDDGVTYRVRIVDRGSLVTDGVEDFTVVSEKYYMHVDPAIHVLATTRFGATEMPVAWTTTYGRGRVFYCSLGHTPDVVAMPAVLRLVSQGFRWAAR